ncbi:MAG: hypothetical protein AAB320_02440 [Elusimicrobiota bacterium]
MKLFALAAVLVLSLSVRVHAAVDKAFLATIFPGSVEDQMYQGIKPDPAAVERFITTRKLIRAAKANPKILMPKMASGFDYFEFSADKEEDNLLFRVKLNQGFQPNFGVA